MASKKLAALFAAAVLAVVLTASFGFSISANCYTLSTSDTTPSTATNRATIGVASNFWGPHPDASTFAPADIQYSPALSLVQAFLVGKTSTSITVCHDATETLEADLSSYSMIFGADTSMVTGGYSVASPAPFVYAKGIPVFFGVYASGTMDNVNDLISSPALSPGPYAATVASGTALNSYVINTNLTSVADSVSIADTPAPYGDQAHLIVNAMAGTALPGTVPTWVFDPLWPNIGQTFQSVISNSVNAVNTTSVKAGFVAKSQICSGIAPQSTVTPPAYVYVQFNGYTLEQAVGITTTAASAPNNGLAVATSLRTYIQNRMLPTVNTWGTFLNGFCYTAP